MPRHEQIENQLIEVRIAVLNAAIDKMGYRPVPDLINELVLRGENPRTILREAWKIQPIAVKVKRFMSWMNRW